MPSSPTVTSTFNASEPQGSTHTGEILGTGFVSGATVTYSGTGVNVSGAVSFINSSTLGVVIVIDSGATLGARNVTVTNPDTGTGTGIGVFTVTFGGTNPTVTAISPTGLGQGASNSFDITGTGFVTGATVTLSGSGLTIESTTFNSATSMTIVAVADAGATVGARNVTVTNPDTGTGTGTGLLTIGVSPVLTDISPNNAVIGTGSTADYTMTGTGFVTGAVVALVSGTYVTVNSTTFVSSTELTVNITLAGGGLPAAYDLDVTNPDGGFFDGSEIFTVVASTPTVTGVSPTSMAQGATGNVVITGTGFFDTPDPRGDFGAFLDGNGIITGITQNSTTFNSSTSITINVTLAADATLLTTDVGMGNPDTGGADLPDSFTITPLVISTPHVTSTSPSSRQQGATGNVAITGTGFVSGATVAFSGSGITINTTTFGSSTLITVNVTLGGGATVGARNITVTNPDTGSGTGTGVFSVSTVPPSTPTITSTSPTSQTQGVTGNVTITGTAFASGAVASFSGSGVTVSSTTFNNVNSLTAFVSVSGSATTGARTLTVTNPDSGTATRTFTVNVSSGGGGITIGVISPSSFDEGTSGSFTVVGTGFVSGIAATFAGTNITVNSTTFNSSTSVTVNITVAGGAGVSTNALTLTNPDATAAGGTVGTTIPGSFSLSAWRWVLTDSTVPESYTMEINPNAGGSLGLQKNITTYQLTSDDGEMVLYEGSDSPQLVVVSGTLLTQAQYNHMVYWYSKRRPIQLTDDLARTMWVYFAVFTPTRAWSFQYPWRHTWSASFYVVGQQAVTAL